MFYLKIQNNTFGKYVVDDLLGHFVAIEAESLEEANDKASELFSWEYCPCCGPRWNKSEYIIGPFPEDTGRWFTEEDKSVNDIGELEVFHFAILGDNKTQLRVHLKNGIVESYTVLNTTMKSAKLKPM